MSRQFVDLILCGLFVVIIIFIIFWLIDSFNLFTPHNLVNCVSFCDFLASTLSLMNGFLNEIYLHLILLRKRKEEDPMKTSNNKFPVTKKMITIEKDSTIPKKCVDQLDLNICDGIIHHPLFEKKCYTSFFLSSSSNIILNKRKWMVRGW